MSPTLAALGIDRLTLEQRVALAQEILDTVVADRPLGPLSEAKRQELDRRIDSHAADPSDVVPWTQIEADLRARFGT